MLSKRDFCSDKRDPSRRRSKDPMSVLTATGKVQINEDARVFVYDFDPSVTVRLLDETPAVLLLRKHCSKHEYSFEWKSVKLHDWPKKWKSIICTMDNFVLLVVPGLSSFPAAVCLQHRDQRTSKIISENWDCYQIQFWLAVTSMHAGNRCWQILTSRPQFPQHTKIFQTRCTRRIQRRVFLIGYSPSQLISRTWSTSARTFLWKRELRFGRRCLKSGDTKIEAEHSYSLLQIPKEINSTNRRDWWHENSRAQKWISEQSPIRCRGTRPQYQCETQTSQETEKILRKISRAVTEARSLFI